MHPLLRATAERQLGLFTAADARRAGYGHPEMGQLFSTGTWIRVRRGIYVTADRLASIEAEGRRHGMDCLAVLLELRRQTAVISHESAARLWGFPVRTKLLGPLRLTDYDQSPVGALGAAAHSTVWAAAIGVLALTLWRRRVRVAGSSGDHLAGERPGRRASASLP